MTRFEKIIFGLGIGLVIAAVVQSYLLSAELSHNQSVRQGDVVSAATHGSEFGKFSAARQFQLEGVFEQAHAAYAAIDVERYEQLRTPVLFYLAENYVAQAVNFEKKDDDEQRIPLLELAKENYRKILATDADNWSARVNLAQVLRMLPDARLRADDQEDIMPERSPQAEVQTMGIDRLP